METASQTDRCYRHPGVETRISCSQCGRPICTDCMHPAPVGQRCPECAGERQVVKTAGSIFGDSGAAPATQVLLGINVAVFLAQIAFGSSIGGGLGDRLSSEGGLFGPAIDQGGEWWRILTAGFLHSGILHLGLNMFALYVLGRLLEPRVGTPRFIGIYFASLLAGSFGALLLDPTALTVGASGAIYGILAAAFLIERQRGSQVASEIGIWLLLNLIFTFSISGISIGGHLGGLAGGAAAAGILLAVERQVSGPRRLPIQLAGLVAVAVISVTAALIAAGQGGV